MTDVVITEAAWADMLDIARHVAIDNVSAADRLVEDLYDKCRSLGDNPLAFQLMTGYEPAQIRRRLHGNYLICYRHENNRVEILRILHGARDYDANL